MYGVDKCVKNFIRNGFFRDIKAGPLGGNSTDGDKVQGKFVLRLWVVDITFFKVFSQVRRRYFWLWHKGDGERFRFAVKKRIECVGGRLFVEDFVVANVGDVGSFDSIVGGLE